MRCGQTNHVYFGRSEDSEHFLAQKEGSHSDGISGTDHQGECLQIPWGQETEENVSERGDACSGESDGQSGRACCPRERFAQVPYRHRRAQDQAALLPNLEPRERKAESGRDPRTDMFRAALLTTAQSQKQPVLDRGLKKTRQLRSRTVRPPLKQLSAICCYNMDEPRARCAKPRKPVTEGQLPSDSIHTYTHTQFLERT